METLTWDGKASLFLNPPNIRPVFDDDDLIKIFLFTFFTSF